MKVVINRSDAIGDLLLTLPMVNLIKEKYPKAHISLIVSHRVKGLVEFIDLVDEVHFLDLGASYFKRLNFFKKALSNCTHFFHVGGDGLACFAAFLKGISYRGGMISRPLSFLFLNKGLRQSRSKEAKHEVEFNLDLLAPLEIVYKTSEIEKYQATLSLDPDLQDSAKAELDHSFSDSSKDLVVIHPGMSGHTLNWPKDYYPRFIERLLKDENFKSNILISHTPSDEAYLEPFRTDFKHLLERDDVCLYDGSKKGLSVYLAILSKSKLVLAPSTGVTHMANILGRKQIGIYSPIRAQSALRWGPFVKSDNVRVFSGAENEDETKCMSLITIEDVYKSYSELVYEKC